MSQWYLYMIRTAAGTLYTGITTEPERRLREHGSDPRRGARALRGKGPLELVYTRVYADRGAASRAEYRVKRLSREQKECLLAGRLDIATLE